MALRQFAREACARLQFSYAQGFDSILPSASLLSRSYAQVLDGLKYNKSHEWLKIEGDVGIVGISDFAQDQLGDVVYVELPETGAEIDKDATFGVVESVKTASDVYMPVSGTVLETNQTLTDQPDLINKSAYEDGWIIKVKLSNKSEVDALMDAKAYAAHVEH